MFEEGTEFNIDYKVTKSVYSGFISTFQDLNPLHNDSEFAKQKGFKDKVMFGNILNGFLSNFIGMQLPTKDVIIHSQNINYKKPVYLNDTITLNASVYQFSESTKTVVFKYQFVNQNSEKVANGKIQIGLF